MRDEDTIEENKYGDLPADGSIEESDLTGEELRLLFRDHESAGEDARYRDRMVHTGFYLSLIFSGVILNTGIELLDQDRFFALSIVAGFGSISFYVLWVWTESFLGARDAAWNRRRQIEYEIDKHRPRLLKAHSDVFSRLDFDTDARKFEHTERTGRERLSSSKLTVLFIQAVFISAAIASVGSFSVWSASLIQPWFLGALLALLPFVGFFQLFWNIVIASGSFERD